MEGLPIRECFKPTVAKVLTKRCKSASGNGQADEPLIAIAREDAMRMLFASAAFALAIAAAGGSAEAKGCMKGAAVGGIAGHIAGHGAAGAAAGCAVGSHRANKKQNQQAPQPPQQ
jgi:hypothetical protein